MAEIEPFKHASEFDDSPYDVMIIGGGISGINSAFRIQERLPSTRYLILEARQALGGTWDLFRYPGIRSDSDMISFSFAWRPWIGSKVLAGGDSIRSYLQDSASLHGIDKQVRFGHRLVEADWSSEEQLWKLKVAVEPTAGAEGAGEPRLQIFHTRFLLLGTGYYNYASPLATQIPGIESFSGRVIHPQFWPSDYNARGQRIAIIGSGATAVTLVPSLSEAGAAHVTMLQRSPTYIVTRDNVDLVDRRVRSFLPRWIAQPLLRFRSLLLTLWMNKFFAWYPVKGRALIAEATAKQLEGTDLHVDPHFKPRYEPWRQRLCFAPDGDFFQSIRDGNADVVTGVIDTVTTNGIKLQDSKEFIEADAIVTATGLRLQTGGGATLKVDGQEVNIGSKLLWKTCMFEDVPNCAWVIGYVNNSWTLGADATAVLICRLLKHMKTRNIGSAVPRLEGDEKARLNLRSCLDLTSTYVAKGDGQMPRCADIAPWRPRASYFWDLWDATFGSLTRGLEFEKVRVA